MRSTHGKAIKYGDDLERHPNLVNHPSVMSITGRSELPTRETRNIFVLQFYEVASLQGRLSYALMSIYMIHPEYFKSYLGSHDPQPYLFANMIYGYSFLIFSRITFMTMPLIPRVLWSFLGSMMFNYSSMITFNYIARVWGPKSPNPKLFTAILLSFLYGRVYSGSLMSFLDYIDSKVLSLVRRINNDPMRL